MATITPQGGRNTQCEYKASATPGTFWKIWANVTAAGCSGEGDIEVIWRPLDHIVVTPNPYTMTNGDSHTFWAVGWNDAGETEENLTCMFTWEKCPADGATLTPLGAQLESCDYQSATDGTWTLWANCSGISGSTAITV